MDYVWSSGNQTTEEADTDPDELIYEVSPETPIGDIINISVLARNIQKELELAGDSLTLVVIK